MLLFHYAVHLFVFFELAILMFTGFSLYVPSHLLLKKIEFKAHLKDKTSTTTTTTTTIITGGTTASTTATQTATTSTTTTPTTTTPTTTTTEAPLTGCFAKQCGGTSICLDVTESGGIIQSPNYPKDYGANLDCRIAITVPPGKKIKLTFVKFIVETCCDRFAILDGTSTSAVIAVITGYTNPAPITSTSEIMTIKFTTDFDNSLLNPPSLRPGRWQATYSVV